MYWDIWKIVSYFVYLWILMIICYGGYSQDGFFLIILLQKIFGEFSQVCDVSFIYVVLFYYLKMGIGIESNKRFMVCFLKVL